MPTSLPSVLTKSTATVAWFTAASVCINDSTPAFGRRFLSLLSPGCGFLLYASGNSCFQVRGGSQLAKTHCRFLIHRNYIQ